MRSFLNALGNLDAASSRFTAQWIVPVCVSYARVLVCAINRKCVPKFLQFRRWPNYHNGRRGQILSNAQFAALKVIVGRLRFFPIRPRWVGLVLGRDFNSRGMETCRGSIPPTHDPLENTPCGIRTHDLRALTPDFYHYAKEARDGPKWRQH